MKILHVAYADLLAGAMRAAYRLHTTMVEKGISSQLLVSNKMSQDPTVLGPQTPLELWRSKIAKRLEALPLKLFTPHQRIYHSPAWVSSGMIRRIKQVDPNIVQLHWIGGGVLNLLDIEKLKDWPIVWRLPDMWAFCGAEHYAGDTTRYRDGYHQNNRPKNEKGLDINRWVFERKRRAYSKLNNLTIVCPSHWMAEKVSSSLLLKDRPCHVIHTGIDLSKYYPISKDEARDKLKLPKDKILILYAAVNFHNDPRKGLSALQAMFKILKERSINKGIEFIEVGNGPSFAEFAHPLKIHKMGYINDETKMLDIYNAADVFLAPYLEDNLPNTILEALACGTPIIAFRAGGVPDAVHHQINGWLSSAGDVQNLLEGVEIITRNANELKIFSQEARKTAESKFDITKQALKYKDLYENILNNHQSVSNV